MFHYFEAITNTSGDSLIGYFARVVDPATQNTVTISADDNGTPIVTTSGVENAAVTDAYGNLDFYVAPGTYHLDIYAPNATSLILRVQNVSMNSTKGDTGDTGPQGDPGEGLEDVMAPTGSSLVGFIQNGTGAVTRTTLDKARERVSVLDYGADPTGATNSTAAFSKALAYILTRPGGGEIYIPAGFYDMDMNCTDNGLTAGVPGTPLSDFAHTIHIVGAGRGCTVVRPAGTGSIVLNMLGRNRMTVSNLTIRAGDKYQAACGVYVSRSSDSQNANNNKFLNIEVEGNFSGPAVISCGAESSLWINSRIAPGQASAAKIGFWTGDNPALAGVTPTTGTPVIGPNTDNRMIACEVYMPYTGAQCVVLSRSAGWLFDAAGFIIGTVSGGKCVTVKDFTGSVFNGPVHFRDCHWEAFGTATYGIYVAGSGLRYIYDISVTRGYLVVNSLFTMIEYENRGDASVQGSYFLGGCFEAPAVAGGDPASGANIYMWACERVRVNWRPRTNSGGLFRAVAFALDCLIEATTIDVNQVAGTTILLKQMPVLADVASAAAAPTQTEFNALTTAFNSLLARLRSTGSLDT